MFTRPFGTLVLAFSLLGGVPAAAAPRALVPPPERPAAPAHRPALPLAFVPNAGQAPAGVYYAAQAGGFGVAFTPGEARLALGDTALALRFLGARPDVEVVARERLPGTANYAQGRDPSRWHAGLPTYREVVYRGLWPGIDLAFRGEGGSSPSQVVAVGSLLTKVAAAESRLSGSTPPGRPPFQTVLSANLRQGDRSLLASAGA